MKAKLQVGKQGVGEHGVRVHGVTEHGATMVEFALVLIVIIALFGLIFDIGMGIHRYAMLKQVTTESTRQIAVRLQTHRDCSYIETYLRDIANSKLRGSLTPGSSAHWETSWELGSGLLFPVFRVEGSMHIKCFFVCTFFQIPIKTRSEIVIERKGIGPAGAGCPNVYI